MRGSKVPADILLTDNFVKTLCRYGRTVRNYVENADVLLKDRSDAFRSAWIDLNAASRLLQRLEMTKAQRAGVIGRIDRAFRRHTPMIARFSEQLPDELARNTSENMLKHFARLHKDIGRA